MEPFDLHKTNEENYAKFCWDLKDYLRENKISNIELGKALNMSDQTISNYLNWDTKKGRTPFWVPTLKLFSFLALNIDKFLIEDIIKSEILTQYKQLLKKHKALKNKYKKTYQDYNNSTENVSTLKKELEIKKRENHRLQIAVEKMKERLFHHCLESNDILVKSNSEIIKDNIIGSNNNEITDNNIE